MSSRFLISSDASGCTDFTFLLNPSVQWSDEVTTFLLYYILGNACSRSMPRECQLWWRSRALEICQATVDVEAPWSCLLSPVPPVCQHRCSTERCCTALICQMMDSFDCPLIMKVLEPSVTKLVTFSHKNCNWSMVHGPRILHMHHLTFFCFSFSFFFWILASFFCIVT